LTGAVPPRDVPLKVPPSSCHTVRNRAVVHSGQGSKIGLDTTNKWPGETQREWGTPIVMDEAVKQRVDEMWEELGL